MPDWRFQNNWGSVSCGFSNGFPVVNIIEGQLFKRFSSSKLVLLKAVFQPSIILRAPGGKAYACVCVCIYIYIYIHTHIYWCKYMCVCVCMYVCMGTWSNQLIQYQKSYFLKIIKSISQLQMYCMCTIQYICLMYVYDPIHVSNVCIRYHTYI